MLCCMLVCVGWLAHAAALVHTCTYWNNWSATIFSGEMWATKKRSNYNLNSIMAFVSFAGGSQYTCYSLLDKRVHAKEYMQKSTCKRVHAKEYMQKSTIASVHIVY